MNILSLTWMGGEGAPPPEIWMLRGLRGSVGSYAVLSPEVWFCGEVSAPLC